MFNILGAVMRIVTEWDTVYLIDYDTSVHVT